MSDRAAAFVATLMALPTERARLCAGSSALRELYRELVRAAAPPNPQFERERIIAAAENPRELVFLFGLLSEGENEAALLLDLTAAVLDADAEAAVAHIVDEAWYYVRTSIDDAWQLDDGPPSAAAAIAYLFNVLTERLKRCSADRPARPALAAADTAERAALLRSLRAEFAYGGSAPHPPERR